MSAVNTIDSVLARQLKKEGLADVGAVPDLETWGRILQRVSEYYKHVAEDRDRLSRSIETSTEEMTELHRRLEGERQRLRAVVSAFADALGVFREVVTPRGNRDVEEATSQVSQAKMKFATRLKEILTSEPQSSEGGSSTSEVENLGRDFLTLADSLVRLIRETAERATLKKELEVAGAVQQLLLPEHDLIERPFAKVAAFYRPASECGGDWWAAHDLADGRYLIVVGDVTGHGIASAIITGAAKAACDLAMSLRRNGLKCEELLRLMNAAIHGAARQRLLMTCIAAIIDPRSRSISVANAGHGFPYLVREQNGTHEITPIVCHGAPLGANQDSVYSSVQTRLNPGDVLVWYTDGLVECEDERGEHFGEKRLKATLQHAARWHAPAIRDSVAHAITRFASGRPQKDDITFVVARMNA
ncbi:MAG TPA: PP2C family protein-serine/threonine phosphatase [Longimicrobium sp.]|nr:PP2C family protein-serine/threonine phosphatase [Longimicrobium sp.]